MAEAKPKVVMTNPAFDYSQLSKDEADKLRYFEGELIRSRKRVSAEIITHGQILHNAQQSLSNHGDGVFREWLNSVGISKGSAYNAIAAYEQFNDCPNLDNLEVSAMYELAKNSIAKKKALRLADKGIKVTHAMAQELIAATKITAPIDEDQAEANYHNYVDELLTGEDDSTEAPVRTTQEQAPEPPRNGTDKPGEKCPNCAGTRWTEDDEGLACAKCGHPYGEPAGDVDEDRIKIQVSKTIKTCEALMRALDDLELMKSNAVTHAKAITQCKWIMAASKEWK